MPQLQNSDCICTITDQENTHSSWNTQWWGMLSQWNLLITFIFFSKMLKQLTKNMKGNTEISNYCLGQ